MQKQDLIWRGLELFHGKTKVAELCPETVQIQLWRIKFADGTIGDLYNETWAKDNAVRIVLDRSRR